MRDLVIKAKNQQNKKISSKITILVKYFNNNFKDFFETQKNCIETFGLILKSLQNNNFDSFMDFAKDRKKFEEQ